MTANVPSFRLDDRVCLVTGGAGHLGSAMSSALAEAGGHVCIVGRNQKKATELAAQLTARGLSAEGVAADITLAADRARLIAHLRAGRGRLDVLVNNAYSGRPGTMDDIKASDYASAFDIAVSAAAELLNAGRDMLAEAARTRGDAAVVNIASMYGMVSPNPAIYGASGMNSPPHYGAVKAALLQFTRYAACHLAPLGIRVNAVSPGPFPPESLWREKPDFCAALTEKVPLGRLGQPADLSGVVAFLASPAARYVTGVNLPVDGGWTAW
jgi:NAD(P)-dependent dehydrogenase (short-subunit alcohol dehydrogenase family)